MKKNLFTKAMSFILSAGLVSCMLPSAPASADETVPKADAEPVVTETSEAYVPDTTTAPAETTAPVVTTAPVGTTAPSVTTTAAETQFTLTYTGTTAVTTAQTVLRTTRTRLPDEGMISCGVNAFMDGAYVGFGQTLENVYMVEIEYPEEIESYAYEAGLCFDLDYDGEWYQVVYPLSILSYNSKEGSYSTVCIVNDFSYAAVRYGDVETTVSALDAVDFQLCDKLYEALTACDSATLEITERAPSYSGTTVSSTTSVTTQTTTVPSDGNYVFEGEIVTIPVFYTDLPADVESVTRDDEGTIIEITKTENLNDLLNIHVLGVSEGESIIRVTCTDGSVLTIPVRVLIKEEPVSSVTGSTTTVSTVPQPGNTTTASSHSTTRAFTTTPPFIDYPEIKIDEEYAVAGEYNVPEGNTSEPIADVEIMQDGILEVSSAETVQESETGKYVVILHGIGAGTAQVKITVYGQEFYYLVTVTAEEGGNQNGYDVNADGIVDISDAAFVLNIYAMKTAGLDMGEYSEGQTAMADVDGDGTITLNDAVLILTYYAENAVN